MGSNTDERRYRESHWQLNQIESSMNDIDAARERIRNAKSGAPIHVQTRLETLESQLSQLIAELNDSKSDHHSLMAGSKHQIRVAGQDQHEARPDK